ncbi:Retrovirus-related Pol polyprotein from type-1 retrotransposable element R2 [Formica fusca]
MPTLYKVYTTILAERLREEVEVKELVPENQVGFRKGRGVMDNIYVLNYIVQRQIAKPKGKVISLFVDLKAAFDTVDKEILIRSIRERGVREGLIERIEEVLRETKSRVRIGGEGK